MVKRFVVGKTYRCLVGEDDPTPSGWTSVMEKVKGKIVVCVAAPQDELYPLNATFDVLNRPEDRRANGGRGWCWGREEFEEIDMTPKEPVYIRHDLEL